MAGKTEPKDNLIGMADFLFSFCGEKKPQNGEDSFVYALNESRAMLGVFDGCGGSGAGAYEKLSGKTGAYLASRAAAAAWMEWFEALESGQEGDLQTLKVLILRNLKRCEAHGGGGSGSKLMGMMTKRLPTTAAVALCRPCRGGADVQLQWAGDSRVYLLDRDGLRQLTEDDLGGIDAMENLSRDGVLTNVISLSRDFQLHTARLTMGRPGLLFAATDGCFGYLSTPMEFEYLLLSTLQNSPNAAAWEKALEEAIGKLAGDDYTISGICLGFGDYDGLRRQLAARTRLVYRTYINGLDACSAEEKLQLWEHYRETYYSLLCRP